MKNETSAAKRRYHFVQFIVHCNSTTITLTVLEKVKELKTRATVAAIAVLLLTSCCSIAQDRSGAVTVVGKMKDVMWKGQLSGIIITDTISRKENLYGLGPVEYLRGEILIIDGKFYRSTVVNDSAMKVEEASDLRAPFFGYANIDKWSVQKLPDSIATLLQLEQYLGLITVSSPRPFMFKLSGTIEDAVIHIVNLPEGSKVSSPQEAHRGLRKFSINNEQSDMVGFFSTEHKTIFTHHDTFMHIHLITSDKKKMGHLEEAVFRKGTMTLYLPEE